MTFGSLFAGIGGFDLGFERAGMRCVWQVEIDPYCRRVLSKHWPDVPKWDDVRTFTGEGFEKPDVICGGFPCQDISNAGPGDGIDGKRSGLWSEYARIIRLVRPRFVVVENVAALLVRGMGRVVGELVESGYDCEWDCIPAAAVGAPHRRDRLWIVAHAISPGREGHGLHERNQPEGAFTERPPNGRPKILAHAMRGRQQGQGKSLDAVDSETKTIRQATESFDGRFSDQWSVEPDVGRVAHGVPARVDRLKGLGNAVVPQVAQWIGERLMRCR